MLLGEKDAVHGRHQQRGARARTAKSSRNLIFCSVLPLALRTSTDRSLHPQQQIRYGAPPSPPHHRRRLSPAAVAGSTIAGIEHAFLHAKKLKHQQISRRPSISPVHHLHPPPTCTAACVYTAHFTTAASPSPSPSRLPAYLLTDRAGSRLLQSKAHLTAAHLTSDANLHRAPSPTHRRHHQIQQRPAGSHRLSAFSS